MLAWPNMRVVGRRVACAYILETFEGGTDVKFVQVRSRLARYQLRRGCSGVEVHTSGAWKLCSGLHAERARSPG